MSRIIKDKTLFILDGSGFIFRSYFALPSMLSPKGEPVQGVFGFIRSFNKLQKDFDIIHVVSVFDGPNNKESRKAIYEEYKSNRTRKFNDLPQQITFVKKFCQLISLPYIEIDGVEADDVIGSIAKVFEKHGFQIYICSSDKDLCQLVNENIFILNPWKNNLILKRENVKDLFGVYPENIADYLALVGDSVDNIPGIKGCGPKGAVELLKQFSSIEALLVALSTGDLSKQLKNIKNSQEILQIGKKLATIDTSIPFTIPSDMFQFFNCENLNFLYNFYKDLGFGSLIKGKKKKQEELVEETTKKIYKKISSFDEFKQIEKLIINTEFLSFIFHYEGTFCHSLNIFGLCLCIDKGKTFYIAKEVFSEEGTFEKFVDTVLLSKNLIGFSVKNDLHVLKMISKKDFSICFDVAIASYLLHTGNKELSLQELAKNYLELSEIQHLLLYENYKRDVLLNKNLHDYKFFCEVVEVSFSLYHPLKKALKERLLFDLFQSIEMPLIYSLFLMERAGVFINVDELYFLENYLKKKLYELEEKIYGLVNERFNINSSKQLSYILFDVLKLPSFEKRSTKAEVLESLIPYHPVISELLSYRILEKLRSTYVVSLPKQVDPVTHRIHPTFIQTLTSTGRLACQAPNLQNIPIKTELGLAIRHAFCPQFPDRRFISFDYSQIELRFLAHFSNDKGMIEAFFSGQDIHTVTASEIFEVSLSEVTKEQRRQAKAVNFGLIYGQQAYGLSKILKISLQRAKELISSYFSRYPSINKYLEKIVEQAMIEGKVSTLLGREREISGLHSSNALERNTARRLAVNTPMQGSAADLIKLSMVRIHKLFLKEKVRSYMILQVHDELIFEIFPEEEEFLISEIKTIMETSITLRVPLVANISIGKNWSEC